MIRQIQLHNYRLEDPLYTMCMGLSPEQCAQENRNARCVRCFGPKELKPDGNFPILCPDCADYVIRTEHM